MASYESPHLAEAARTAAGRRGRAVRQVLIAPGTRRSLTTWPYGRAAGREWAGPSKWPGPLIESLRSVPGFDPGEGRASALQLAEAFGDCPRLGSSLSAASFPLSTFPWSSLRDGVLAEPRARGRWGGIPRARPPTDRVRLRAVVGAGFPQYACRRTPRILRSGSPVLRVGARISPELAGRLWRVDARGTTLARLSSSSPWR